MAAGRRRMDLATSGSWRQHWALKAVKEPDSFDVEVEGEEEVHWTEVAAGRYLADSNVEEVAEEAVR